MLDVSWITSLSPVLIFLAVFILVYVALKKLKIPGSDTVLAVLSLVTGLLMISSERLVEYSMTIIPWMMTLFIVLFFGMLTLALISKDLSTFTKPLAWIGFVAIILIVLCASFDSFPTAYHMLPGTSDAYLSQPLEDFKEWFYTDKILHNIVFAVSALGVGFLLVKKG